MGFIAEFNDMARFNINQVMMMPAIRQIVTCPPATKITPFQNATFFKQAHRAIDRGYRNTSVALQGTAMQFLHIRMIFGFAEDACDQATLAGHLQPLGHAKGFNARTRRGFGGFGLSNCQGRLGQGQTLFCAGENSVRLRLMRRDWRLLKPGASWLETICYRLPYCE